MKILNPTIHGAMDYALALFFLAAPAIFGFSEAAATISYVVGGVYIGASLITKYPLGLLKLLPFPVHGVIETLMALSWFAFPWIFGFADDIAARNFFIIAAVGLLLVVSCTDYKAAAGGRLTHA